MSGAADAPIFIIVIAARFIVPLFIPRFPIPGIVAALVLDGVDGGIFERFTTREFPNYQSYDKALDVYYLTIAYVSTLRNWPAGPAFEISRFLWYYRLLGVLLFELSGTRAVLFLFPNTFEYYFIFIEAFRLQWSFERLTWKVAGIAAAAIWIGIKLPQEYWIHIAQRDVTDTFAENPWLFIPLAALLVIAALAAPPIMRRLPGRDHVGSFHIPIGAGAGAEALPAGGSRAEQVVMSALLEKLVLVAMICVIFANILPNLEATNWQMASGVSFVIVANALFTHWLARRGTGWFSWRIEFAVMAAVNFGSIFAYVYLLRRGGGSLDLGTTLFFVLLLTLIVMLFDRYHQERSAPRETRAAGGLAPA